MQPGSTRPFIIWTLQRTGGTNLTQRLIELGHVSSTEHEPFNAGRRYGKVAQRWAEDGDIDELNRAMTTIAARGEVIKHCVEMVPPPVSRALAEATTAAGYQHLFLYRRKALRRLLSLHFAQVSGIWGPEMKDAGQPSPEALRRHRLPVAKLVAHERRCVAALAEAWDTLLSLGQAPSALAFEDLYAPQSPRDAEAVLARLLHELGVDVPAGQLPRWMAEIVGKGEQGTRQAYDNFSGVEDLARALGEVKGFVPAPALVVRSGVEPSTRAPWICRAVLDGQGGVVSRRSPAQGLVILAPGAPRGLRLVLSRAGREELVTWGIRSPWAQKKYPQSPNAGSARFSTWAVLPQGISTMWVEDPATGERQPCLDLQVRSPDPASVVAQALTFKVGQADQIAMAGAFDRELERIPHTARDTSWREAKHSIQAVVD